LPTLPEHPDTGFIYRSIVEQAHEAIIFIDCDGVVGLWNHGAETLFGFSADEVMGHNIDVIIPERFRPAHAQGFGRAVSTGKTRLGGRVLTTRANHKSGQKLYVDMSFGLVKDGERVLGAFAVARDGTERFLEQAARRAAAAG
jgi:PAS domain S-box-containing protein